MKGMSVMQKEVVKSKHGVTIVANGIGAGNTYALFLKAIDHALKVAPSNITFICATPNKVCNTFFHVVREMGINASFSKNSLIVTFKHERFESKVKFTTLNDRVLGCDRDMLIVDRVDHLTMGSEGINLWNTLLRRRFDKVVVTASPSNCGNHKHDVENVWDYQLLNSDVKKYWAGGVVFKASPADYKSFVKVVTGYSAYHSVFLEKSDIETFERLPQETLGLWM